MRKLSLVIILSVVCASLWLYAQEPEPADPAPEPGPAPENPEQPEGEPEAKDGKVVVYVDIIDYVDGEKYKWRVTEFLVAKTFELADKSNEDKWKEEQKNKHDWSKFSNSERDRKIEKDYRDLRKKKGVDKLDLGHIKVVQWRPKPKEPKEGEKKDKPEEGAQKEEPGNGEGEKEQPAGETNIPAGGDEPKDEPKDKPAPKKEWVDPKETADYLVMGEVKFAKGKKAKYFGNTVAWNSLGELHVKVIRRVDFKVIKEYKEKLKRSHTLGQERAHQQCMQDLGQEMATSIVNLSVFKK